MVPPDHNTLKKSIDIRRIRKFISASLNLAHLFASFSAIKVLNDIFKPTKMANTFHTRLSVYLYKY